jgi:hypothetical protein
VPRLIKFSGAMKDFTGKPLMGPADINFAIYKEQTDAAPLWQETQTLQLDERGYYTVLLGAMRPEGLPMELFTSAGARWLEVSAAGAEPQPRTLLVSVPYALKAGDAETLGGKPPSAYLLAPENQTGWGTTTAATTSTSASSGNGATGEQATLTTATRKTPMASTITGTQNYIPVFTDTTNDLGNSVLYQTSGNVGVGTTDPSIGGNVASKFTLSQADGLTGLAIGNGTTPRLAINGNINGSWTAFDYAAGNWIGGITQKSGNVGIGTTDPSTGGKVASKFTVSQADGLTGLAIGNGTTPRLAINGNIDGSWTAYDYAAGNWVAGITQGSGNVGIGTAFPTATLEVNGKAKFDGLVTFASSLTFPGGTVTGSETIGSGDLSVSAGNLDLPATTSASAGVIDLGGSPFIHACCPNSTQNTFVGGAGNFTADATPTNGNTLGGNTAVGYQALQALTSGIYNTASGYQALYSSTTGSRNTVGGFYALFSNTGGTSNTASGFQALFSNTGGTGNTAIGEFALLSNTEGNLNTAVGYDAGVDANTFKLPSTGVNSTFIGAFATATVDGLTNATAIGYSAQVGTSNALVLGAPAGSYYGGTITANTNVGIDVGNPSNIFTVLQGGGHAISDGWDTYSSRRWKSDIRPLRGALGKVERLRGVSYTYTANGKHDIGMIAEEVGKVVPEVVSYEDNGKDARGIDYARLTALLVEAVKQQQNEIQQQQWQIGQQKAEIRTLQARLRRLEASHADAVQPVTKPGRTAAAKAGK